MDTIDQHCKQNWQPGTWATQVEVVAAATVFAVPVFFTSQSGQEYKWNVIYPLSNPTLKYPDFPDMEEPTLLRPPHFELLYHTNLHYDAIVSVDTGRVCTDQPVSLGTTSELIELSD